MPNDAGAIGFRPVEEADLALLAQWLERPHWREWWGEPQEELAMIRDMVEGRDTTLPFLILIDGEPAGYIQRWLIGPHQCEPWSNSDPWVMELPAHAVGVDLSLADAEKLSKGIGSAALRLFAQDLERRGNRTIVIDPDPENLRAVRAYQKAGFRPVEHLLGRTPGVLIMQYQSQEEGTT
jgi:RimJ/RimL family protein N-acetyltransferase